MRQWINLIEEADEPYIEAHRSGEHTIEIEMMYVPPHMRGTGEGRRYYEAWEKELPSWCKYVKIWAADTGSGKSNGFWDRLGFEYCYAPADRDDFSEHDDIWWWMIKGVNGTPTPATQIIDPNEDD